MISMYFSPARVLCAELAELKDACRDLNGLLTSSDHLKLKAAQRQSSHPCKAVRREPLHESSNCQRRFAELEVFRQGSRVFRCCPAVAFGLEICGLEMALYATKTRVADAKVARDHRSDRNSASEERTRRQLAQIRINGPVSGLRPNYRLQPFRQSSSWTEF
jgi:hypothetical protein